MTKKDLEMAPFKNGQNSGNENVTQTSPAPAENIVEAPITRPFEGYTYIKKEWVDQEDGIEKVTLNVAFGHPQLPADWTNTEVYVMMPEWGSIPLKRSWVIRIPSHFEGKDKYLFHYYFQSFHANGPERVSHAFTQLISPQEFEYIDYSGDFVFVRLHWSVGNWSYVQDSDFEVDGITWGSDFSVSQAPFRWNDRLYQNGRAKEMQKLPIPRHFRCFIWVPKGAVINYCFQLIRICPEGFHIHWENNLGKNFLLTI
ncbi:hypothetical protein HYY75_07850 [bacterium]|nr:hypothetical protein [bacterium]